MKIEKQFQELARTIRNSGEQAHEYFISSSTDHLTKSDGSVVTEIDQQIERDLLDFVQKNFPDDAIVGEEYGDRQGNSSFVWHIDPIDGTDNFLRKIPFCGVSVARLGDTFEDSFGIVYNPLTRQMFSSLGDEGVFENEHVCNLTSEPLGGRFVISIGRGKGEPWMKKASYALQEELGNRFGKCLAYGSTALELAYIAANRIDAYLTFGLKSYDYAAGLFIARTAGARISVHTAEGWSEWKESIKELCSIHGRTIFVSHPDIHEDILSVIGDPKKWSGM